MHTSDSTLSHPRSRSLDIAKGIAIILMILGHAEIILNNAAYSPLAVRFGEYEPVQNLYNFWLYQIQSSVDAFYMFAGLSLALATQKKCKHLIVRQKLWRKALILVLLDLTVVSWSFGNNAAVVTPVFGSLSSFALSFICMSFLISAPSSVITGLALAVLITREIIVLREPFDPDSAWSLLYGLIWGPVKATHWSALFSLTSWLPIVLLGFCLGRLLIKHPRILSLHRLAIITLTFFATFFVVRKFLLFGSLGQPLPHNFIQIFQLTKYPASIHFHLLNLGWAFFYLFLGKAMERVISLKGLNRQLIMSGQHMLICFIGHLVLLAMLRFSGFHHVFANPNYTTVIGFVIVTSVILVFLHWYTDREFSLGWSTKKLNKAST